MRNKWILVILLVLVAIVAVTAAFCAGRQPLDADPDYDIDNDPVPMYTTEPEQPVLAKKPELSFTADEEHPLPTLEIAHKHGRSAKLSGTIHSDMPLTAVRISISCKHNDDAFYPHVLFVNLLSDEKVYSYSLDDDTTLEGLSIDEMTRFADLQVGLHTLKISAMVEGYDRFVDVTQTQFNVLADEWLQVAKKDFNGTYESAYAFFQDDEKFLCRYQWVYGRYIIADPAWEEQYITSITAYPDDKTWLIHVDALPYYEKALSYLENTYLRVRGTNGDSGVLPLSDLIISYAGSYLSRFTSSLKTISHHCFGTATDINSQMGPNLNKPENRELVDTEVREYLSYNGMQTENGLSYYEFAYAGNYPNTEIGIPESVINYLLYELAFYRAGFQWAHYYKSTSDAMHFTLTDAIARDHSSEQGLRKVFEYFD